MWPPLVATIWPLSLIAVVEQPVAREAEAKLGNGSGVIFPLLSGNSWESPRPRRTVCPTATAGLLAPVRPVISAPR